MKILQKRRERIDYRDSADERRRLTRYLRAGNFRSTTVSPALDSSVRNHRLALFVLAGLFFLTGAFFVLF